MLAIQARDVYGQTAERIARLEKEQDTGAGRAKMAEIRRGAGKAPGELPAAWGILFQGLPEDMYAKSGQPTKAEWAIYTALTLYALHQQGSDRPMQEKDMPLGRAVSRLCHNADGKYTQDDRERIERRFFPLATADSMAELTHHLRGIVQLLKAEKIPLDYPALASDLYRYQLLDGANAVRLKWGQDFYRYHQKEENTNEA